MKKLLLIALQILVCIASLAQTTKTATIKGYSPALKDSTIAECFIDNALVANVPVIDGHFTLTVPVDKLTQSILALWGEGCPNYSLNLMLSPNATVELSGTDCLFPLWKVNSSVPEQQTINRIMAHNSEAIKEYLQLDRGNVSWQKGQQIYIKILKQTMDILPSLPVDAASICELERVAQMAKNINDSAYTQQLKELEASTAARAPKGFEKELALIHAFVYPEHVLQVGEEAVDTDFLDMQGNTHHLAELLGKRGQYVLLDFWSLGCGPCRMAEPEMREIYERMKGKLEIVGINQDKLSAWQTDNFSKSIAWKNWNDGKLGKGGIESRYCDMSAVPYYVLLSPEGRILWKAMGYGVGWFFGLAETFNCPKQDNGSNLNLVVRHTEANSECTKVSFRYYSKKGYWFRIVKESYLEANGKKYKLTAADGIKLDVDNFPEVNVFTAKEDYVGEINYSDFTLTFEPFESIPTTFDFKEGDSQGAFVIRDISLQ